MSVQLSPLQLEGYFVREFQFALRPGFEERAQLAMQAGLHFQTTELFNPDPITINMQAGSGVNQEDPLRWITVVEVESRNGPEIKFPYDFRVVLVGYFNLNATPSSENMKEAEAVIKINSASMLYSAARELIAGVTGRGPLPAAVLPSILITLDASPGQKQSPATKKEARLKSAAKKTAKKGVSKKQRSR